MGHPCPIDFLHPNHCAICSLKCLIPTGLTFSATHAVTRQSLQASLASWDAVRFASTRWDSACSVATSWSRTWYHWTSARMLQSSKVIMALRGRWKSVLLPQRWVQNQWGRGLSSQLLRASVVKRLTIQASCLPLAMALSPATHPSFSCLMKTAGLSPSGPGTVSRGRLSALSSYPSGHSNSSSSISWIHCLRAWHSALTLARCFQKWFALLLYISSLCCRVVARPATSEHSWAGARFSCPVRTFWTVHRERGPSQKALVLRSWRGLGMAIWLEGMGSEHEAESTSWSVTMTDSCSRWPGSWTGSRVGEKAMIKLWWVIWMLWWNGLLFLLGVSASLLCFPRAGTYDTPKGYLGHTPGQLVPRCCHFQGSPATLWDTGAFWNVHDIGDF